MFFLRKGLARPNGIIVSSVKPSKSDIIDPFLLYPNTDTTKELGNYIAWLLSQICEHRKTLAAIRRKADPNGIYADQSDATMIHRLRRRFERVLKKKEDGQKKLRVIRKKADPHGIYATQSDVTLVHRLRRRYERVVKQRVITKQELIKKVAEEWAKDGFYELTNKVKSLEGKILEQEKTNKLLSEALEAAQAGLIEAKDDLEAEKAGTKTIEGLEGKILEHEKTNKSLSEALEAAQAGLIEAKDDLEAAKAGTKTVEGLEGKILEQEKTNKSLSEDLEAAQAGLIEKTEEQRREFEVQTEEAETAHQTQVQEFQRTILELEAIGKKPLNDQTIDSATSKQVHQTQIQELQKADTGLKKHQRELPAGSNKIKKARREASRWTREKVKATITQALNHEKAEAEKRLVDALKTQKQDILEHEKDEAKQREQSIIKNCREQAQQEVKNKTEIMKDLESQLAKCKDEHSAEARRQWETSIHDQARQYIEEETKRITTEARQHYEGEKTKITTGADQHIEEETKRITTEARQQFEGEKTKITTEARQLIEEANTRAQTAKQALNAKSELANNRALVINDKKKRADDTERLTAMDNNRIEALEKELEQTKTEHRKEISYNDQLMEQMKDLLDELATAGAGVERDANEFKNEFIEAQFVLEELIAANAAIESIRLSAMTTSTEAFDKDELLDRLEAGKIDLDLVANLKALSSDPRTQLINQAYAADKRIDTLTDIISRNEGFPRDELLAQVMALTGSQMEKEQAMADGAIQSDEQGNMSDRETKPTATPAAAPELATPGYFTSHTPSHNIVSLPGLLTFNYSQPQAQYGPPPMLPHIATTSTEEALPTVGVPSSGESSPLSSVPEELDRTFEDYYQGVHDASKPKVYSITTGRPMNTPRAPRSRFRPASQPNGAMITQNPGPSATAGIPIDPNLSGVPALLGQDNMPSFSSYHYTNETNLAELLAQCNNNN
ncbi:hypothetical protein P7C71_g6304, partial [Lecanoromycetidae sp. Uapishka_2]